MTNYGFVRTSFVQKYLLAMNRLMIPEMNTSAEATATGVFAAHAFRAPEFSFLEYRQKGDFKNFHPNVGITYCWKVELGCCIENQILKYQIPSRSY